VREYRQVDQKAVGMAILAHPAFKNETASGVAQTANSYDPSGLQPAFVVNVQLGDGSVTLPGPGETTDQIIYYYFYQGQPTEYVQHSNLVPPGTTVLTRAQLYELGKSLEKIHNFFLPAYGPPADDPTAWYALEVDFKFNIPPDGNEPALFIKQARPLPSPFGTTKP
jgi:pyruvate, water dikinase